MATNEIITSDGEIVETTEGLFDPGVLAATMRAEIDAAITTARAFPRSIQTAVSSIVGLATLDEQSAEECVYALRRDRKMLRGPSIRLAEIVSQRWGNCRVEARIVNIDKVNKVIIAEGVFHDLETNMLTRSSVTRRISTSAGKLYGDDMITVTCAAAASIARRNAIFAGVPKGIWRKGFEAAEQVIRGDVKTLGERRDAAIVSLGKLGLQPEQVFALMDVKGVEDIDVEDLITLTAIRRSLKDGETTVEELMRSTTAVSDHKRLGNPLKDDAEGEAAGKPAGEARGADKAKTTAETSADGRKGKSAKEWEAEAAEANAVAKATATGKPGDDKPKPEPMTPKGIAYARGQEDRAANKGRKDMPAEYSESGREVEAEAWLAGLLDEEPA